MKISILSVKDHGDLKKERVILKAIGHVNIGDYLLADTTYLANNEVSNELRHIYWIPDKVVEKDDLVVIYTKSGRDSTKANESGNRTHFFYWGLEKTIWNKDGDAATLFLIGDWVSKSV